VGLGEDAHISYEFTAFPALLPEQVRDLQILFSLLTVQKGQHLRLVSFIQDTLKGQSHEKFGEMRARGLSLGHNLESLWVFKFF
jgi:hypothetical protein